MADVETGTIRRSVFIAAEQAVVFAFLTEPDKLARWMGSQSELDLRPGGLYLLKVNDQSTAQGEFEEVTPNSRIVYSFGWQEDAMAFGMTPGSTRVEIDLTPVPGGTQLHFVHSGLPSAAAVAAHGEGWDHYLARLAIAAAGGDPGPDWQHGTAAHD